MERSRHIHVAGDIEGQSLRAAESPVVNPHHTALIDGIDRVEAGGARGSYEKRSIQPKGEMVSRNTRLQGGKDKNLPVLGNFENGSSAIAHVQIAGRIK